MKFSEAPRVSGGGLEPRRRIATAAASAGEELMLAASTRLRPLGHSLQALALSCFPVRPLVWWN